MKILEGDLIALALQGEFDVIVHGCNCLCTMGAGIAKTIKQKFPEAYEADLATEKGSRDKLGTITSAKIERDDILFYVVNAYTQYTYRGRAPLVDYDAVEHAFECIKTEFSGKRIGYPTIGAGLAGGDWDKIADIIDRVLDGEDHTLVIYKP